MLPPALIYRSILIPHPTEVGKTTTMRVEEDYCNKCSNKSNYPVEEEELDLDSLGLNIPEVSRNDY